MRVRIQFVLLTVMLMSVSGARVAAGGDPAVSNSDSAPVPMICSFKGGLQNASNFRRHELSGVQDGGRFTAAELSIEAHDLRRFIAGAGAEFAWRIRSAGDHMYVAFLYGTIGYRVWKRVDGRARIWGSFDIGRIWCGDEVVTPGIGNSDDVSGTAVRLRASYLRHLCGTVALGVTGGWQWSEPRVKNGYRSAVNSTPRVNLSGPMIAAQLSLVSPLGKSSCSP